MSLIYIFATILVTILLAIIVLSILEHKSKKELKNREGIERSEIYRKQLKKIVNSKKTNKNVIELINNLAKKFFKEFYPSQKKLDYSNLFEKFGKENNKEGLEFSGLMLKSYYSPNKITAERIKMITNKFNILIEENTERIREEQRKRRK